MRTVMFRCREKLVHICVSWGSHTLRHWRYKAFVSGMSLVLLAAASGWWLDLQIGQDDSSAFIVFDLSLLGPVQTIIFTRALTIFWNSSHESAAIIFVKLSASFLDSLNLIMQLLNEGELIICDLVLLLEPIIFKLESANGDLEQLVLALTLHGILLVKLVLYLLILIFLLPGADLLPQLLLVFLSVLVLAP